MKNEWIETFTHRHVTPHKLQPQDICIEDLAHALSNICRFTGHTSSFYSVAQHSVYTSLFCSKKNRLWGLLHDASEAYLCDVSSPVKHLRLMRGYRIVESNVMAAIVKKFELISPMPAEIHEIDKRLVFTEAGQLGLLPHRWGWKIAELEFKITPWTPKQAEQRFLSLYNRLLVV
jgi:hypothetical protein